MPATQAKPSYIKLTPKLKADIKADPRWAPMISCVHEVWQIIGSDVMACDAEMGETTTTAGCLESCLDADRMTSNCGPNGKAADAFCGELFKKYGYTAVSKLIGTDVRF